MMPILTMDTRQMYPKMFPIGEFQQEKEELATLHLNENELSSVLSEQTAISSKFSIAQVTGQGEDYPFLELKSGEVFKGLEMYKYIGNCVGLFQVGPTRKGKVTICPK